MRRGVGGPAVRRAAAALCSATASSSRHPAINALIVAYRDHGHLLSTLDPLGLPDWTRKPSLADLFDPATHGLTAADMARPAGCGDALSVGLDANTAGLSNEQILEQLARVYTSTVGVQVGHLPPEQQRFVYSRVEVPGARSSGDEDAHGFSSAERVRMLERLSRAHYFEAFCASKFAGIKRFGLEGCESLIVGLDALVERAAAGGVQHVVMGMPHRGRLNVLANTLQKPVRAPCLWSCLGLPLTGSEAPPKRRHSPSRGTTQGHTASHCLRLGCASEPDIPTWRGVVMSACMQEHPARRRDEHPARVPPVCLSCMQEHLHAGARACRSTCMQEHPARVPPVCLSCR